MRSMSVMFEASRVPPGHGFRAAIKNPQPYGMRLANVLSAKCQSKVVTRVSVNGIRW